MFSLNNSGAAAAAAAAAASKAHNPNNDYEVPGVGEDAISDIAFSQASDFFVAASWDGSVKLWQVNTQDVAQRHMVNFDQPALCCAWAADGSKFFAGSTDKTVKMVDMTTGQAGQIGQHDGAVSSMRFVTTPSAQLLATASWDKTLRYWDLRSPQPALSVNLSDRCYAMDVVGALSVVATADRMVYIFNLTQPSTPYKDSTGPGRPNPLIQRVESPLKYQTRCIAAFPNMDAFAIGSIEGRVGIQMIEDAYKESEMR